MAITDSFFTQFIRIQDRTNKLIYTVPNDQPVVVIGGNLTINSDETEVINIKVVSNSVEYLIIKNFKISNINPEQFINSILKLALNPGDQLYIQALNSYGIVSNPDIYGFISFVKQPKLV